MLAFSHWSWWANNPQDSFLLWLSLLYSPLLSFVCIPPVSLSSVLIIISNPSDTGLKLILNLIKYPWATIFCSILLQFPFFLVLNLFSPQWVIIAAFSTVTGIDFLITWGMCYYLWKIRVAVSRFFFWFPILYLLTDITIGWAKQSRLLYSTP